MNRRFVVLAVAVTVCGGVAGVALASNRGGSNPLSGHAYTSVSISRQAATVPVRPGEELRVSFKVYKREQLVEWTADCNISTAEVTVEADQLIVRGLSTTLMACRPDLLNRDEWLREFFQSGPQWSLVGERLTLSSDDVRIDLVQDK